jgi:hypothetical protein
LGEDWLLENQDKLKMREQPSAAERRTDHYEQAITEDDVPF